MVLDFRYWSKFCQVLLFEKTPVSYAKNKRLFYRCERWHICKVCLETCKWHALEFFSLDSAVLRNWAKWHVNRISPYCLEKKAMLYQISVVYALNVEWNVVSIVTKRLILLPLHLGTLLVTPILAYNKHNFHRNNSLTILSLELR